MSVNQPLTDSEARNIFINGAEDFYSLSANPQFSNVAELFDAWLTARTEPSRAYIQGCKAARSLLEDAIRDLTQEQGTL